MRIAGLVGMGVLCVTVVSWGQSKPPDPKDIVVKSLAVDNRNQELLNKYTYRMLEVEGASGEKGSKQQTRLYDVFYVAGERFRQLVERDGQPLPEDEARKVREKLDKATAEAQRMSPEERRKHEADAVRRRSKNRDQRQYIPEAFAFQLLGEDEVNGRMSWKISAEPTGTYRGPHADLLRNMRGTLWIDQKDYEWTKVEAESLGTISFGWFLARLGKGAAISFENQRVNAELWAPRRVSVRASVRIVFVAKATADMEITFTDYKKFQSDSRVVSVEPEPAQP
jgi:hypothetical protein